MKSRVLDAPSLAAGPRRSTLVREQECARSATSAPARRRRICDTDTWSRRFRMPASFSGKRYATKWLSRHRCAEVRVAHRPRTRQRVGFVPERPGRCRVGCRGRGRGRGAARSSPASCAARMYSSTTDGMSRGEMCEGRARARSECARGVDTWTHFCVCSATTVVVMPPRAVKAPVTRMRRGWQARDEIVENPVGRRLVENALIPVASQVVLQ